ncbi:hypothetical protein [Acuticoccus sp. I52.16.1]|uniref:hypothetical protein n=1 Tax=Acuticoccus sp. I52.16.1 TaxID=2928472 RepID=UPI001FD4666A|nr:hypothetical protein [Acuticoccus sp. I52.16.1]UOM37318.1 hypothetical protein MRB58_24745 [Acuticoccus sp. I52.16.1]
MQSDRFERTLHMVRRPQKSAVIDVTDTAHIMRLWLLDHGYDAAPEHVIAMTKLVLEREALPPVEA